MSYTIGLNSEELSEINYRMKKQKDIKIYKRLIALKMKNQGITNHKISEILDVHIDTVTDWFKLYIVKGLNELCELHLQNRKKSKLDYHLEELKKLVEEKTISTIAEFQNYISNLFGIEIEHSWLSRYCKKNSIVLIKRQG
jgi:transposase